MSNFRGQDGSGCNDNDLSEIKEGTEIEVGEPAVAAVVNKYLQGSSDSVTDDEDGKTSFFKLEQMIDLLENAIKINDWVNLQEMFEKLNKQLEKFMRVTESVDVPKLYVRALVMLEDFLCESVTNKEAKKNMSNANANANALSLMKQKLEKNNKQYEELIQRFRENHAEDAVKYEDSRSEYVTQIDDDDDDDDDDDFEGYDLEGDEAVAAWEKKKSKEYERMDKLFPKQDVINLEIVRKMLKDIVAGRVIIGRERMEELERLARRHRRAREKEL